MEQCFHYIKPILDGVTDNIECVRLSGKYSNYSKLIAPIIYFRNPDILITAIVDGVEHPLFVIEFTTSVFTEDHELQKFDGVLSAVLNDAIYVKISPTTKISSSSHGGNTGFNYLVPYTIIKKYYNRIAFHIEWPLAADDIVETDTKYVSCPPVIPQLVSLLHAGVRNAEDIATWIQNTQDIDSDWSLKLDNTTIPPLMSSSRVEIIDDLMEFKINRFGHGMDPERGMLAYYGVQYPKINVRIKMDDNNPAWYKDTPAESQIDDYIGDGFTCSYDYLHCFMLVSGLAIILPDDIDKTTNKLIEIDIGDFVSENYACLAKTWRIVFANSVSFTLADSSDNPRVKFVYTKQKYSPPMGCFPKMTPLSEPSKITEDEVTYVTIHNFLSENNYTILAASYPGAQGDRVILPKSGTGRKQPRRYIDVIAYLENDVLVLQNNKGQGSKSLQPDIDELNKFKTEDDYLKGLDDFKSKHIDNANLAVLRIGVGFWAHKNFNFLKNLDLQDLDYFIYISQNKLKWNMWSSGNNNLFKITSGDIHIPKYYVVGKDKE